MAIAPGAWRLMIVVTCSAIMALSAPQHVAAAKRTASKTPPAIALTPVQHAKAQTLYTAICARLGQCRPELGITTADCDRAPDDSFIRGLSPKTLAADDTAIRHCAKAIPKTPCADFLGNAPPTGCENTF